MENLLKEKLDNNQKVFGTFIWSCSDMIIESLGYTGLDFVIIDAEHSPVDSDSAVNLVRAAKLHRLTPIIRSKAVDRSSILKMLDLGAEGLIIPNLKTLEEVQSAIYHAKYPSIGMRGFAYGCRAGFGYEPECKTLSEYFNESNSKTLLLPMCETVEMLKDINTVASMPGVDGIFVGPYDLSIDMGIPGEFDNPKFVSALKNIADACKNNNKYAFIFSSDKEAALAHFQMGYAASAVGIDTKIIIEGYKNILSTMNEKI